MSTFEEVCEALARDNEVDDQSLDLSTLGGSDLSTLGGSGDPEGDGDPEEGDPEEVSGRNMVSHPKLNVKKLKQVDATASSLQASIDEGGDDGGDDTTGIITPRRMDVLCGRGHQVNTHDGNVMWREAGENWKEAQAAAKDKQRFPKLLVSMVQNDWGGRFLRKQDDGTWREIDDRQAIVKCQKLLREKKAVKQRTAAGRFNA